MMTKLPKLTINSFHNLTWELNVTAGILTNTLDAILNTYASWKAGNKRGALSIPQRTGDTVTIGKCG